MARPLLPDELWKRIEPLLPPPKPRRFRFPGRKPIDNRKALTGILFVLKAGIPREDLPREMGCGCGMTCWRRRRDWQADGTWAKIHTIFLDHLRGADPVRLLAGDHPEQLGAGGLRWRRDEPQARCIEPNR